MTDTPRALSDLLQSFLKRLSVEEKAKENISIAEILEEFHERGFGVILFFFALPMALPLPVPPVINVILATPLLLLTAQQTMGRHKIWLPASIKKKTMSVEKLIHIMDKAIPFVKKMEYFIRPRLGFITQGGFSLLIGMAGFIMALSVCVPLPLSNTVPSFGIALMAIGVVMRDGLAVITGMLIGVLWVSMYAILGQAFIRMLIGMIAG